MILADGRRGWTSCWAGSLALAGLAGWSRDGGPGHSCWTLAEHAGDATPDGLQHLLAGAVWDHDAVRDDIRDYLVEHFGDPGAVLVVDETGDLKKVSHTVGVQRQYTGTAGKVDNAQVAVNLAYATAAGHGVIDYELYLLQGWIDDPVPRLPLPTASRPATMKVTIRLVY